MVLGDDLTIKFTAFPNSKVSDSKVPKDQGDTLEDKILVLLKANKRVTQREVASQIGVSVPSIKRTMKRLVDNGTIVRRGGKRYGYWEIN